MHPDLREFEVQRLVARLATRKHLRGLIPEARREQLDFAHDALLALPADGVELSTFAERITGDAHALDRGTWLGTYIPTQVARDLGLVTPGTTVAWRNIWSRVGVFCDGLSSTVLTAGLRPKPDLALSAKLWAWPGSPSVITLRELREKPLTLGCPKVYCVENPVVVERAVAQFGEYVPPIICSSGWPSTATLELLKAVTDGGGSICYHGDFDWSGLSIATRIGDEFSRAFTAWQYSSCDYEKALREKVVSQPLKGERPADVGFHSELAELMEQEGRAVYEEALLESLMRDMRREADLIEEADSSACAS